MSIATKPRVVITGIGIQSALGSNVETFFKQLCEGATGIRKHPNEAIKRSVGFVDFEPANHFHKLQMLNVDRVSLMSVVAAQDAAQMAQLPSAPLGEDVGVYFGTGAGGVSSSEHAYSKFFGGDESAKRLLSVPAAMIHAPASHVAMKYGVRGECQTYSTACSSSSVAIGEAYRRIRDGYVKMAIAGGADCVLTPGVLMGWSTMQVLCPDPEFSGDQCKPFSADRAGFAMAEGAAVFVLESLDSALARGVQPLAEIVGYGISNDASHITKPNPEGQALAMRRALLDAKLEPQAIGHINAHGTATQAGDWAETQSIKAVFGEHAYKMPIAATKSAHGHTMGASGAIELVATLMALKHQIVPPTTYYGTPDPACDLDYVPRSARVVKNLTYALSNSFAFGGNNAALIAKRFES